MSAISRKISRQNVDDKHIKRTSRNTIVMVMCYHQFRVCYVSMCLCLSVCLSVCVKAFIDDGEGHVVGVKTVLVKWSKDSNGRWSFSELPGFLYHSGCSKHSD